MIRPVNPDSDASYIAQIYNRYITETTISFETTPLTVTEMKERIGHISQYYPYFVYETAGGEIAGYCYAHPWKERAAYSLTLETTIYLSPEYFGNGIALALMQSLIKECRERGYKTLIACITADNRQSINFHTKLGFEKVSHFKQVGYKFGQILDVIDLQLLL